MKYSLEKELSKFRAKVNKKRDRKENGFVLCRIETTDGNISRCYFDERTFTKKDERTYTKKD